MNGIISEISFRNTISSGQWFGSIAAGACLFSGFLLGSKITFAPSTQSESIPSASSFDLFKRQSIDFSKISWINEQVSQKKLHLKEAPESLLAFDLPFVPYELPVRNVRVRSKRKIVQPFANHKKHGLQELQAVAQQLKVIDPNIFEDYKSANEHIRAQFQFATYRSLSPRVVAMLKSEPANQAYLESDAQAPSDLLAMKVDAVPAAKPPVFKRPLHRPPVKGPPSMAHGASLVALTQKKAVEKKSVVDQKNTIFLAAPVFEKPSSVVEAPIVQDLTYPVVEPPTVVVNTQNLNTQTFKETVKQTLSSSEETKAEVTQLVSGPGVKLSNKEKSNLANALLNTQVSRAQTQQLQVAQNNLSPAQKRMINTGVENQMIIPTPTPSVLPGSCAVLNNHKFIKPTYANQEIVNTQICPETKMWISKDTQDHGWAKVTQEQSLPTLTFQPAPNNGATLLLDQNALALMAITTGVHIAKGMGVVTGLVPKGYKVEFSGRGEETQYFESNGNQYFAVLNAEPGANVIQLISDQNPNAGSSVFTPVLENTVTYLDLGKPQLVTLGIQVVKSGEAKDPEVSGLTIGISTQGGVSGHDGIQGITQADGRAILKNAYLVPGFPVYIDVSSKYASQKSYTYRYELKNHDRNGFYVVNQVAERSLYKWLRQEKQGLSDQSAMVVGFYDRKKRDGFKNNYFAHVESKTAKFGLEPRTYSVLWDGKISATDPLEGDKPRFMSVQVPEGLSQVQLTGENHEVIRADLFPISPRVIHVVSE